jgi:hypothetical protein
MLAVATIRFGFVSLPFLALALAENHKIIMLLCFNNLERYLYANVYTSKGVKTAFCGCESL